MRNAVIAAPLIPSLPEAPTMETVVPGHSTGHTPRLLLDDFGADPEAEDFDPRIFAGRL
jgi:hypothetical protein